MKTDSEKELKFLRTVFGVLIFLGMCSLVISPWMLLLLNFFAGSATVVFAFSTKATITRASRRRQLLICITAVIFGFLALGIVCWPEKKGKDI
ncbi:MAG TPA: hypothetical protein VK675_02685 [Candidatus Paceibacterota bacterium]|nr:hypothetical protein [Candidatus Paceibacterota bacterium]